MNKAILLITAIVTLAIAAQNTQAQTYILSPQAQELMVRISTINTSGQSIHLVCTRTPLAPNTPDQNETTEYYRILNPSSASPTEKTEGQQMTSYVINLDSSSINRMRLNYQHQGFRSALFVAARGRSIDVNDAYGTLDQTDPTHPIVNIDFRN